MKNLLTILCCFFLINLTAQDWKTFTYNKNVLDIEKEGNTLWIATSGGLLEWNLSNETYTKLTTENGLISNQINKIVIDSDSRKWLATRRGVSVVDGGNITSYDSDDGLYANDVNSIVIDSEGNKWFGTKDEFGHSGISKLDNQGNWSTIPESIGFAPTCLAIDSSDNIYVGKNYQIAKYTSDGNWVSFAPQSTVDNVGYVSEILVDQNQDVWSISSSGLFHFDVNGNKTKFDESDGFGNSPRSLFQDGNGTLWVGTHDGITKVNSDTTFTNLSLSAPVNTVFESDGNIFLGTDDDITLYDGTNILGKLKTDVDLAGNAVQGIDIANDGSVWMGTERAISKFSNSQGWKSFGSGDELPCYLATNIFATSNNEIVALHRNGCQGTSFIDVATESVNYIETDTFKDILSINEDNLGNIWLGSYYPVIDHNFASKISPNGDILQFDFTNVHPDVSNNKTTGVAIHPNGDVYFSSRVGIYRVDTNDELHLFNLESAFTIFIDSQENIWFAEGDYFVGGHAVEKYTPSGDHITYPELDFSSPSDKYVIYEIAEDAQQNMWFATENGLYKLSPAEEVTRFSTRDGLADNDVTGIVFDANGEMWISTKNGVSTTADIFTATSNLENKKIEFRLYPNPTLAIATLDFDLEKNENVQVEIFNVAGQLLLTPFFGKESLGNHQLEFDVSNFSQGVYFCKIKIGGWSQVLKFVKM
ncbi:MAG: two-component regulator propeller domain-containing protein [Saprospiraceae bacterium]